jgi:hypothetical protein
MHTTLAFAIQAFDCSIYIENACPELQDTLERYIFPVLPKNGAPSSSKHVVVCINRADGAYRVSVENVEVVSTNDKTELLLSVLQALDEAVIYRLQSLKAVHAGAVVLQDRAILIPGRTHAGKSSMVAELLRRGAKLLSDEYALIDGEGRVHSYPRPLLLRDSHLRQSPTLPSELGSEFIRDPVPVGWILALEYQPGSSWEIQEVPLSEAMMILLRNTPHPMAESPAMIDSFVHAVSEARCFTGARGDAAGSADQIMRLIGAPV